MTARQIVTVWVPAAVGGGLLAYGLPASERPINAVLAVGLVMFATSGIVRSRQAPTPGMPDFRLHHALCAAGYTSLAMACVLPEGSQAGLVFALLGGVVFLGAWLHQRSRTTIAAAHG